MAAFAARCVLRPRLGATHLERYRNRQLRRLLRHAAVNVPYYRALWTASGTPWEEVGTVDDIGSLPVTSNDIYGTTECNVIAFECPQTGGYHVCDDSVIVQICRDGVQVAPGESGDVVVTSLHSRAMPLIRIQVGDRAIAGESRCPCGSPFSTLQRIEGRVCDAFELPGGRVVHPFELTNEVMDAAGGWVEEFQIAQVLADKFVVRVVGIRQAQHADVVRLRTALLSRLPSTIRLDIQQVQEIERDAGGKLHYCRTLHRPASQETAKP